MIDRGYRHLAAILAGATLIAFLVAGLGWHLSPEAHAQQNPADTITAPYAINGRIYEWPAIGTPEYSDSCRIVKFYEDGYARAWCAEDGALFVFDPDGQFVPNIPGNPVREPGWYVADNNA